MRLEAEEVVPIIDSETWHSGYTAVGPRCTECCSSQGYKASLLHRSPSPSSISRNSGFGAWKVNNSAWTLAFSYGHDRGGSREAPSEGFQMGEYPTKGSGHRGRGEDMTGFMRIGDRP